MMALLRHEIQPVKVDDLYASKGIHFSLFIWCTTVNISDATGLNRFNIKFFTLQCQMSGINIKKTQDCYQNLLYNMVPLLHIHHRCMKPSLWLIIASLSCRYLICCIVLYEWSIHRAENYFERKAFHKHIWKYIYGFRKINYLICNWKCWIMLKNNSVQVQLCRGNF